MNSAVCLHAVTLRKSAWGSSPDLLRKLRFTATVKEDQPRPNREIDDWAWFSLEEAKAHIKPGSLAEAFLRGSFDGNYVFPERSRK